MTSSSTNQQAVMSAFKFYLKTKLLPILCNLMQKSMPT